MPSPFPGMDPYLEGSEWTSLHAELCSEITRQLAPQLRPKYIVRLSRRFITEMPEDLGIVVGEFYPDVALTASAHFDDLAESSTAILSAPVQMATVMPARVPHLTIEIRDVAQRELVTAIEVLSPTNKRGEGQREYLDKRSRILCSMTHLVEIDLLRTGRRVPMQKPLPAASYFVFVSRAERRPITEMWPIQLDMPLPTVPIPLRDNDPDVKLNLQSALHEIYDTLNYDLAIDYARPPEVPLPERWFLWAKERLRAFGINN